MITNIVLMPQASQLIVFTMVTFVILTVWERLTAVEDE